MKSASRIAVRETKLTTFQGPIPPPEILASYNAIEPGLAGRIMGMAEKEQSHRHEMDVTVISGEFSLKRRGQLFALIIAIFGLFISGWLIYSGRTTGGTILGGTLLLSLVLAFLTGRGRASHEDSEVSKEKNDNQDTKQHA